MRSAVLVGISYGGAAGYQQFLVAELIPRITRASGDSEAFRIALDRWLNHWQSVPSDALDLSVKSLVGQHHASSAPAAYRAAVEWWAPELNCSEARDN